MSRKSSSPFSRLSYATGGTGLSAPAWFRPNYITLTNAAPQEPTISQSSLVHNPSYDKFSRKITWQKLKSFRKQVKIPRPALRASKFWSGAQAARTDKSLSLVVAVISTPAPISRSKSVTVYRGCRSFIPATIGHNLRFKASFYDQEMVLLCEMGMISGKLTAQTRQISAFCFTKMFKL